MTRLVPLIAWRYLRAKRDEGFISIITWLSLIGIMLGVATLIIVNSVLTGFHNELFRNIIGIGGHMVVSEPYGLLKDYDQMTDKIKAIRGVTFVYPNVQGQVLVTSKGSATGAMVRGMNIDDIENMDAFKGALIHGSFADFRQNGVLIGHGLADQLGIQIGDAINLISPEGNVTAFGTIPRSKSYRVSGIFDIGYKQYDSLFIYMPLAEAQMFFKKPDGVDQLEIFTNDPDNTRFFRHEIVQLAERGLNIRDWKQMHGSFFTALAVERNVTFVIMTLIILVAALNIISSMIMLVKTKGKDIGILRTMGATRGFIMRVFFLSGASVGIIGTFFGTILGVFITRNLDNVRKWILSTTGFDVFNPEVYSLGRIPADLNFFDVMLIISIALGLTFLATLYPSWKAAKMDPVEALRYE